MDDLKSRTPTEILDVLGRDCPYSLIMIKKTMEKLPSGAILKIFCDSPASVEDSIPRYCEKHGYAFESVWLEEEGNWEIYIQKT
ncbi:MAG: sulfurtransferase TusA family protein [Thermodesulfovibrionales bacterium]|nr:sulfurtransferase TusA family protein [Thermodesulfovibrionales bacterium]